MLVKIFTLSALLGVLAAAFPTIAAPQALKPLYRYAGNTTGKYIVKFKQGISRREWASRLGVDRARHDWDVINGFAATLDNASLEALRSSSDVEYVAEDGIMRIAAVTQTNAPWGLARISQAGKLSNRIAGALNYTFAYDHTLNSDVDIYVLDTGVKVNHAQFSARARWGISYVGGTTDEHGHGTHMAGIAAGTQFGVAKYADIISVQVLGKDGTGATSAVVAGLNWVFNQAMASGRPSVALLAFAGAGYAPLDNAVNQLVIGLSVHTIVAAGNSNIDASSLSPARVDKAITVGATTIEDFKAPFSNYGPAIDVWAPGVDITSSWIGSNNAATMSLSGTSAAAAHVAGVVAHKLAKTKNAKQLSYDAIATDIKRLAAVGVVSGLASGTPNNFVQVI